MIKSKYRPGVLQLKELLLIVLLNFNIILDTSYNCF